MEIRAAHYQKLFAKANKTTERATKFLNKIKSRQLACANRAKSIPENATIRKEYIKCGKEICELKHGPYYYAYWKDPESKKLKKKYIGDHMPKKEGLENNSDSCKISQQYYYLQEDNFGIGSKSFSQQEQQQKQVQNNQQQQYYDHHSLQSTITTAADHQQHQAPNTSL